MQWGADVVFHLFHGGRSNARAFIARGRDGFVLWYARKPIKYSSVKNPLRNRSYVKKTGNLSDQIKLKPLCNRSYVKKTSNLSDWIGVPSDRRKPVASSDRKTGRMENQGRDPASHLYRLVSEVVQKIFGP
jgi:hypothetical protein